jgi:uncharacterized protein (TIGR03437 family)
MRSTKPILFRGFLLALLSAAGMALLQPGPAQWDRPARLSEQAKGFAHSEQAKPQLVAAYGKLPLSFEANQGQSDGQVKFLSRGRGYTLFLTSTEAVLQLRTSDLGSRLHRDRLRSERPGNPQSAFRNPQSEILQSAVLRLALVGANPETEVVGREELPGKSNYFIGNDPAKWRTNVPTYRKVEYREVYPGVSLVYYGNPAAAGQLEYDFVVAPGADPGQIRLGVEGAGRVEVDAEGDLVLQAAAGGQVRFHKPLVYQEVAGTRREVEGSFTLRSSSLKSAIGNPQSQEVGFQLAAYDASNPLVIDPVLAYSTYLGGSGDDSGYGIAVDSSGNAYVTGYTFSSNFPAANPLQASNRGNMDVFVTKLNAAGSALVYSTYLGGSGDDSGHGIAVDSSGSAYVTGYTTSSNFPTANALQPSYGGGKCDAFVTKLNAAGSALVYSTYLGGGYSDEAFGIAVDPSGNAYVTGLTDSSNFPTANALQASLRGYGDAFVGKLNAAGSALVYSTYLGGSGDDGGYGIAVDSSGNAYVTGYTWSGNFPTANALQASNGGSDAFVTRLNAAGSALVYSTYLGGSGEDGGYGIAVDSSGNAYVTGYAWSTNFPTANALQRSNRGFINAFVTKLNAAGSALVYSTYLGGGTIDRGYAIAVDSSGNARVTGGTYSSDFPTANALQASKGGLINAFVTELNAAGSALAYSTYLGGEDEGGGIAVDSSGNAYVAGYTSSRNFPTAAALQPAYGGGGYDAFVAKISSAVACTYSIALASASAPASGGTASVTVAAPTGCTWTAASNTSWITITAGSTGSGNGTVSYSVAANTATASRTGTLTIAGQTFTVTQPGVTCTYAIAPASQSFTASAGTGSVTVTALAGCTWTAASNASWITITAGSTGSGSGTVNYSVAANTATASRTGTLTIAGQTFTVTQAAPAPPPVFTAAAVTNGASFAAGVSPGAIVTIFGTSLTKNVSGVVLADRLPLPTQLAGTSVQVSGTAAPLFAVANVNGQEQINLQVPYEVTGQSTASFVVNNNGVSSAAVVVNVAAAHPGIFTVDGKSGAILHGITSTLVTASNPAARGEVVVIYATGLGPVSPAPATGTAASSNPLSLTSAQPVVRIGGSNAPVLFSGLAPSFAGLYQVNVGVPADITPAPAVELVLVQSGVASNTVILVVR